MSRRFYITALVILRSLMPLRSGHVPSGVAAVAASGYLPVPPEEISWYLANLGRVVGVDGKLALFFPGCRAPAAPFVLYRLKREGYSGCTATATPDGLLVKAAR
jgi:hypothetical protein